MARASFEKGYGARLAEGQSFTTTAKRIAAFAAPTLDLGIIAKCLISLEPLRLMSLLMTM